MDQGKTVSLISSLSARSDWFQHIQNWQASGLSQGAYCKQSGISYNSFIYWRSLFLARSKPKQNKTKFIPIKLTATHAEPPRAIQIKLTSGHQVYLPMTMRLDDIASLLKALGMPHA